MQLQRTYNAAGDSARYPVAATSALLRVILALIWAARGLGPPLSAW